MNALNTTYKSSTQTNEMCADPTIKKFLRYWEYFAPISTEHMYEMLDFILGAYHNLPTSITNSKEAAPFIKRIYSDKLKSMHRSDNEMMKWHLGSPNSIAQDSVYYFDYNWTCLESWKLFAHHLDATYHDITNNMDFLSLADQS